MGANGVDFDDAIWRDLVRSIVGINDIHAKVGVFGGEHPKKDGEGGAEITMVELAVINEFGSPRAGVPERSFIRSTFANKRVELDALRVRLAKGLIEGKLTPHRAISMLGQWGASQCKLTIKRRLTGGPPNAPYTIEKKGSSTPLVDSGRLINAITYEIGMGNGGEAVTVVANTYGPEQEDES